MSVVNDIDIKTQELQEMLINGEYVSSPYSHKTITDNSSGKTREIMRPKFYPDQCIQWAVMQIIEPTFLKGHYHHSCGSIPGKGGHFAKNNVEKWIRKDPRNTKYVLQLDITQYYPSINHDILKKIIRTKIKCQRTLDLIDEIIEGGGEGLPIGNYTSQWFANLYLQKFDHKIKQVYGAKYYTRYMDDIVIFGSNKKKLHRMFREIVKELKELHLEIKGNWQVFKLNSRPLDFLGFKFYRYKTTLRKRNSLRIRRRAKKIGKKPFLNFKDASAMLSYMGWIKASDSYYFYHKCIKPYVNIGEAKGVVRNEAKKRYQAETSRSGYSWGFGSCIYI